MYVTCGVNIRTALMQGGVYDKPGSIDGLVGTTNTASVLVYMNHVGNSQQREVYAVRIDPECVWIYGI